MTEGAKIESYPAKMITFHPRYIRGKVSEDHVQGMYDVLKDSKSWPFPPVHLQPIPASTDNEELIKGGFRFFVLDGTHRVSAAKLLGVDVKAVIHSGLKEADAISIQVSENAKNGMMLNYRDRKRAIDMLAAALEADGIKKGIGLEISKRTGLTPSTVSRIMTGEAGIKGWGKGAGAGAGTGTGAGTGKKFKPEAWLKALSRVINQYDKYRRSINRMSGFPEKMGKHIDGIAAILNREDTAAE